MVNKQRERKSEVTDKDIIQTASVQETQMNIQKLKKTESQKWSSWLTTRETCQMETDTKHRGNTAKPVLKLKQMKTDRH